ncbi:MAG: hypothetical protein MZV65_33340 [Chromatiales bacterium]|nr:hypothetical protein [Chromatiales bacterium]
MERALEGRTLDFRLRVESVAHAYGSSNEASRGARRAVFEQYGGDLLESHRVLKQNPGILEDADLILVMEEKLKEGLPPAKTMTFNKFFGASGDVPNPWPDDDDDAARARYRECMVYLRRQIEEHKDDLLAHITRIAP